MENICFEYVNGSLQDTSHDKKYQKSGNCEPDGSADQTKKKGTTAKQDNDRMSGVQCTGQDSEKGWGWVVTFAAFMFCFFVDGISFSFGVFYVELLAYYGSSSSATSWAVSVLTGTYLCVGPMVGVLVNKFGCRPVSVAGAALSSVAFFACTFASSIEALVILFGLVGGCGFGMMYIPPLTAVGQYFKTRHALAVGIALCGSGIGTLTLAPLSEYLIETYTWKGAMQILSAIVLNGVPLGLLLRPIQKVKKGVANGQAVEVEESRNVHERKSCCRKKCDRGCCCDLSSLNLDLFRSPSLMSFALMNLICSFGYFIPFAFLPAFGQSLGFTSQASAILVSVIGILNTVFRVVSGWVSDQPWANPIIIYSVATILGGAATSLVAYYTVYWVLVAYCVLYGICIGTIMTNEPIVVTMLVNKPKFASAFGIVAMGDGISAMVGAPISGALYDKFGNYRWTFLFSGMTMVLAGFIGLQMTWINRLEIKRTRKLLFKRDGLEIHAP